MADRVIFSTTPMGAITLGTITPDAPSESSATPVVSSQSVRTPAAGSRIFTREDFEKGLRKVGRRRTMPVGENVRDAIESIKGKGR